MTKEETQKILHSGTPTQKINLYMTEVAMFNITYSHKQDILTKDERKAVIDGLASAKDAKYYSKLRSYNRAFLSFKPHVESFRFQLAFALSNLGQFYKQAETISHFRSTCNEMLDLYADKTSRDKALDLAYLTLKEYEATPTESHENGQIYLAFSKDHALLKGFHEQAESINILSKTIKVFILSLKELLKKKLPLKPYREFLKAEEKNVKDSLSTAIKVANDMLKLQKYFGYGPDLVKLEITPYSKIESELDPDYIDKMSKAGE